MIRYLIVILWGLYLLCCPLESLGQLLTPAEFWQEVRAWHPTARQAALLESEGEQALLYARGNFEPKLNAQQQQKTFDGKDYYTYGSSELKWQSAWGIAFKGGYEWTNNDGYYLNPERTIPEGGQGILGVEVPLLRGLFFDEARSQWRQAQLGQLRYAALAEELRNALFMEANKVYWDWSWSYYAREVATDALRYSRERLGGIRASFRAGDYPAIDTLEAYLQVQNWELEARNAELAMVHAQAKMNALLWDEYGNPRVWQDSWYPLAPASMPDQLPELMTLQQQLEQHPSLEAYTHKLAQLQQERRWKAEQFKPELTVSFNLLGDRFDFTPGSAEGLTDLVSDNYKWGFKFSYPLFLRKARAGLAQTDIKIAQTEWKFKDKQQSLRTKLAAYWQEWQSRAEQVTIAEQMVANYEALLEAERIKFDLGESSVFLLNSRQQKLLEAQLKRIKIQAEWQKALVALWYTVGRSE